MVPVLSHVCPLLGGDEDSADRERQVGGKGAEPLLPLGPSSPPAGSTCSCAPCATRAQSTSRGCPCGGERVGLGPGPLLAPLSFSPPASLREQFCLQPPGPSLAPALQPGSRALKPWLPRLPPHAGPTSVHPCPGSMWFTWPSTTWACRARRSTSTLRRFWPSLTITGSSCSLARYARPWAVRMERILSTVGCPESRGVKAVPGVTQCRTRAWVSEHSSSGTLPACEGC